MRVEKQNQGIILSGLITNIWVRIPFTVSLEQISESKLAEYSCSDQKLHFDFESVILDRFWCKLGDAYPILSSRAYEVPAPFVTTYLCKLRFSVLSIRTRVINNLKIEHDMHVVLSKQSPRTEMYTGPWIVPRLVSLR